MRESTQHKLLKEKARDTFLRLGYNLISFDKEIVDGYRPDLILENDYEVLFVEVVVTSDHDLVENLKYNDKPVRFVKYYSLESWMIGGKKAIQRLPKQTVWMNERGRITLPKYLAEASGIKPESWVEVEVYPSLEDCKTLFLKKG